MEQLKNLNRQIRIQDTLSVLITQSTKLLEIVNENQKEVNRLKKELEELKTQAMDIEIDHNHDKSHLEAE
jgi:uncharacterized protein YlxW (UPF0749 family)|tara:strand:+ start:140 stop:349 length:210 start_codon:yes stop_codon:yes gene_type:complete